MMKRFRTQAVVSVIVCVFLGTVLIPNSIVKGKYE